MFEKIQTIQMPAPDPAGPAPAAEEPAASRLRRARDGAQRLALHTAACPAFWLCLLGTLFYAKMAVQRVDQHLTGSYDFGLIFGVVHGWAFHGFPSEPLSQPMFTSEWGDHFAPMLAILAPLLWIHDSPGILAGAQAVIICAAGIPIYFAVRRMHGPVAGSIACVFYLSCMEVQNAIGFDIHENMFEPLLIAIALERALARRWTAMSVAAGLLLLCYEDMGALVFLFGLWALRHRKWRHGAVLCLLGPFVMILFSNVIVPVFGHDQAYWQIRHFDYQGTLNASTMQQALLHVFEHPGHAWRVMFDEQYKKTTWWLLFAPLGCVCLLSPIGYFSMTTIVLLMLSSNDTHGSFHYHFYLQVAPILVIGAADGLRRIGLVARWLWRRARRPLPDRLGWLRAQRTRRIAVVALALAALAGSYASQRQHGRTTSMAAWQFVRGKDVRNHQKLTAINTAATHVPSGVNVLASNDLGTVLIARDTDVPLSQYADYAFFDTGFHPGITGPQLAATLEQQGFSLVFLDDGVYVMKLIRR
ncbi:DUF2079 domain-containing protein [Actinospica robiniae]|uniref:DUF2079 domain-containing protein n=1 Tax=Actinospica robiniae TaxID=304901 RepID=UPI00040FB55A|nr:DUF2079 domain-containing protein [Actinospica robiniae]